MEQNMTFDPMEWVSQETENIVENTPQTEAVANVQAKGREAPPAVELARAEAVVSELERLGRDITQAEPDWYHVALALADGLGEAGGGLFHRVSSLYPDYSEAECEKKWQHALKSGDGRVTLASFYHMAKQAGVDLQAVARQFPSLPSFPHLEEKNENPDKMGISEDFTFTNEGEGSEGSEGNSFDDVPSYSETFSDKLDAGALPPLLRDIMATQQTAEQKDCMTLGSLTAISSVCPNVFGRYGRKKVYANIYSLINAPSASEKGQMPACEKLVEPVEREIQQNNRREREAYEAAVTQYEMLDRATRKATTPPKEPPVRSQYIPLDSSSTACYQALADNGGKGLSFETEADTLTQALKSDYGDYSSGIRKAFHHERISYNRRKENEHVNIAEPRWSILLTCTPMQIPTLLSSNVENGMSSRFMYYNLPQRLEWHDPFFREELTIDDQFQRFGERFYLIYRKLSQRKDHPIEFLLSVEQQKQFNDFFKELQLEQFSLHGDDLVACVRRLGLVCFRLAMLLTILRYEEQPQLLDLPSQSVVCSNEDFRSAMTIANVLINHTGHVYANYIGQSCQPLSKAAAPMSELEKKLYNALAQEFTTKDCRQQAKKLGIPWKTAERYTGNYISKYHIAARVKNGHYRKM